MATAAGYDLRVTESGQHYWVDKDDDEFGDMFEEEEAWEACCRDNNLIQE